MPADSLWNRLLPGTIAHCRRQPFYQRFWRDVPPADVRGVHDLACFPVLRKADLRRFFEDAAAAADAFPAVVIHTSGTTGESAFRMRSQAELKFIWDFFSRVRSLEPGDAGERPLGLFIDVQDHGGAVPMPAPCAILKISLWNEERLDYAIRLLTRTPALPGASKSIESIAAGVEIFRSLTAGLLRRGIDPASLGVRVISVGGLYLTGSRYRWLSETWDAVVVDRWSCSEIVGSAVRTEAGMPFSFDPHVVVEVLDPVTGQPLSEGAGHLVLTELYPFSQLQTLVRYQVGDLVEIEPGDDGATGYRFLGRADGSIFAPDGSLLAAEGELLEALDDVPWIARQPGSDIELMLPADQPIAAPGYRHRWRTSGDGRPELLIETPVTFDRVHFPDAAAEAVREVERRVTEAAPRLAAAVSRGAIAVSYTVSE